MVPAGIFCRYREFLDDENFEIIEVGEDVPEEADFD